MTDKKLPGEFDGASAFANVDRRLALAFGGLILVLLTVVLLVSGINLQGIMEREEDRLSTMLTQVMGSAVNRVSFSGKYHARLLLEEIRNELPALRYVRLADANGRVLAHSDPAENDTMLDLGARTSLHQVFDGSSARVVRHLDLAGESIREVTIPYRGGYDNAVIGVIQVGLSEQEREQAVWRGVMMRSVLVLVLLVMGIAGTWYLSARFGRPIRQLASDLSATLHALPDMLFELDTTGHFRKIMAHRDAVLSRRGESLIGRNIAEIMPANAAATVMEALREAERSGESFGRQILLNREGDGVWLELSVTRKPSPDARAPGFIVLARDITERQQTQAELMLAASVFDNSREGVLITDSAQRILRANTAFCRLTGYSEAELVGQTPKLLQSGHQSPDFYATLWESLKQNGHWQGELIDRRKDGSTVPILLSVSVVRGRDGGVLHYVAVHTDISRIKESEAQLEYQARHDHLTGLANRLMLHLRLEHALKRARRDRARLALLLIDLDRFKDVNDSFGHLLGDALLCQVAERLKRRVRNADTVSRLGGDEFTLLLEDARETDEAARVAEDVIGLLSEPFLLPNGTEVVVGATVGIALYPDHGNDEDALLQGADAALYQAKGEGRGRYRYFSDSMTYAARERIAMESRLRKAIAQNELRLYFQPQIDIASGALVGAEALVRWQCPDEGLIQPGRFIPIAEQSSLIEAIGEWVIRETCRQGQRWLDAGLPPLTLAVNVASRQLMRGDLVDRLAAVLEETCFPAHCLELEMTESTFMEHEARVIDILGRLRALGIRLAIDDFGTGYSSLAYLKRFPLDVLKIDKSFVDDIPRLSDDMEITATIIAMAHTLRLKVLAEGVETTEQLDFLKAHGCDFYQGYLTSRPLPAEEFARLLETIPMV